MKFRLSIALVLGMISLVGPAFASVTITQNIAPPRLLSRGFH